MQPARLGVLLRDREFRGNLGPFIRFLTRDQDNLIERVDLAGDISVRLPHRRLAKLRIHAFEARTGLFGIPVQRNSGVGIGHSSWVLTQLGGEVFCVGRRQTLMRSWMSYSFSLFDRDREERASVLFARSV